MKKIAVVTGGAGFIGSHLVDLLLSKKYQVRVIDDLSLSNLKNLSHLKKNINLKIYKKDICSLNYDSKLFKNANFVFHLAGNGDIVPSIENPSGYINTNFNGTLKVLEASRFAKINKFIYAASSSCYGMCNTSTNEKSQINVEHPYALSKYLGEQLVMHWNKVYNLPANSIRIFNAYGKRFKTTGAYGSVIGVFFKQKLENKPLTIVGNGKQKRDFIHVQDVAEAFLAAALTKKQGQIYNLGTGIAHEVNYLAKIIGGKKISIPNRPGEPKITKANIKKITKELKWKPKIKFKNGIKNMLNDIHLWKDAPLWTPKKIDKATKSWFKYISNKKK